MPDKPLTIATYAAGASLAAITLVYVFAPTFFLDGGAGGSEDARGGRSARRLVVGLVNPANDCFINSVLQALAGLPELRKYLIREVHRRALDGDMYSGAGTSKEVDARAWKAEGLRRGVVTRALKEILDRLNERPIYRKTISAQEFVAQLERAFNTHISRQQQDAQEFLQVVTERLGEEYAAGVKARRALRDGGGDEKEEDEADGDKKETEKDEEEEEESGFPFSGQLKSQIECETCNFKPTPTLSSFVTLILNVPQRSATTLNHCFDGMLKIEHIDDFKCDKCRLLHALDLKSREKDRTRDPTRAAALESEISAINHALASDPEHPPPAANLPARSLAPQRRIKRSIRISRFPKILAIHLSRSIYTTAPPTKNTAKVAFPEHLPLGGVLSQTHYRLLALVTHKGGHNSGHYESFRRQVTAGLPFSTPHSFGAQGPFSR
ncbi:cysteine proteinase, partial [Trichodelitschia bisporula]